MKSNQDAIRNSEAELQKVQRLAQVGSWICEPASSTITWSEELFRIAGRDPSQGAPNYKEAGQVFPSECIQLLNAAVAQALNDGTPYELELQMLRPDQTRRWVIVRGEAERNEYGQIIRLRGTVQDITERKEMARRAQEELEVQVRERTRELTQANEELRRSQERFRILAQVSFEGILISQNGRIVDCNEQLCQMVGRVREEVIGRDVMEFVAREDHEAVGKTIAGNQASSLEVKLLHKGGGWRIAEVHGRPLPESPALRVATIRDITGRKQTEEALRESERRMKRAEEIAHLGSWELDLISNALVWS
ncbi:MAG TPA: PAS domain S-box protein, partial [Clostridia bacterium]|nr:PAS domain S-box protein [Clostridia bacterium]